MDLSFLRGLSGAAAGASDGLSAILALKEAQANREERRQEREAADTERRYAQNIQRARDRASMLATGNFVSMDGAAPRENQMPNVLPGGTAAPQAPASGADIPELGLHFTPGNRIDQAKVAEREREVQQNVALILKTRPHMARAQAELLARNPSLLDNELYGTGRNGQAASQMRTELSNVLSTTNARYDDAERKFEKKWPMAPEKDTGPEMADYIKSYGIDTTGIGSARRKIGRLEHLRDNLAGAQLSAFGLSNADSEQPEPRSPTSGGTGNYVPHAAEEETLARLANEAIAAGADPKKVQFRLRQQLSQIRSKSGNR